MLGILCPTRYKRRYVKDFGRLLGKFISKYNMPTCLFSVSDIDFETQTVQGTCFDGEKETNEAITLPKIILNVAKEFPKGEIRLKRKLLEIDDVIIINETNVFKQLMIKEILNSSAKTRKFLKPGDLKLSRNNEKVSMKLFKNKVIRYYIQKIGEQGWKINFFQIENGFIFRLKSNEIFICRGEQLKDYLSDREAQSFHQWVMEIINYVEKFIPSLGCCYIDIAMDQERKPWFMGLGGWDQRLITKQENDLVVDQLLDNLFLYVIYLHNNARR